MALTEVCVTKDKKYFSFMCEGISIEPKKNLATVIGGEYDGVVVWGVDGVCVKSCLRDMRGRKVQLDGDAFYAEKNGKEIKLAEINKVEQLNLL